VISLVNDGYMVADGHYLCETCAQKKLGKETRQRKM